MIRKIDLNPHWQLLDKNLTFSRIDQMLGHKTILKKLKESKIIPRSFLDTGYEIRSHQGES